MSAYSSGLSWQAPPKNTKMSAYSSGLSWHVFSNPANLGNRYLFGKMVSANTVKKKKQKKKKKKKKNKGTK